MLQKAERKAEKMLSKYVTKCAEMEVVIVQYYTIQLTTLLGTDPGLFLCIDITLPAIQAPYSPYLL